MPLIVTPKAQGMARLNRAIAALANPIAIQAEIARRVAAEITSKALASWDAHESVYGDPRTHHAGKGRKFKGRKYHGRSSGGHRKGSGDLSLILTGKTRSMLRFTSDGGRKIRASLGTRYAKYLIGKYGILPCGNAAMPVAWQAAIRSIASEYMATEVMGAWK